MRIPVLLLVLTTAAAAAACSSAEPPTAESPDAAPPDAAAPPEDADFPLQAAFLVPELLGRPSDTAVTVSVVPAVELELFVESGSASEPGRFERRTPTVRLPAGIPASVVIDGLPADAAVQYRVRYRRPGEAAFAAGARRTLHTARPPGATFRFTVQSDSHLDENSDLDLYRRALANVAADGADFHLDLGDTFMCEKHPGPLTADTTPCGSQEAVDARYLFERGNFGLVAHSLPLFLVNGNHEGELGYLLTGTGMDMATWATLSRHRYYPNPTPDRFYGGDAMPEPLVGQRASYYSFQWGDVLFVTLDPGWYTTVREKTDAWVWTLGQRQYDWLASTLSTSRARYKLVFLHHLVGGFDGTMRGGIEAAPYYEWGGRNQDGTPGFAAHRPGFARPIHQLLVETGVTAVFHGHDHVYVKQDLDGIVYQEVPQPSAKITSSGPMLAAKFHYASGTILSSAGHLRITVDPDHLTCEYVRAWLPASENAMQRNGEIAHAWTVKPR